MIGLRSRVREYGFLRENQQGTVGCWLQGKEDTLAVQSSGSSAWSSSAWTAPCRGASILGTMPRSVAVRGKFVQYKTDERLPFFLWLRLEVGQKLVDLHRFHLGAQMRDAGQEVSLHRGALPQVTSVSLAEHLLGKLTTASRAAMRTELKIRVQEALNIMDPNDREVLVLRHFEELSNAEAAQVLGIKPSATVNRYVRALKRLKMVFEGMPGGIEGVWG